MKERSGEELMNWLSRNLTAFYPLYKIAPDGGVYEIRGLVDKVEGMIIEVYPNEYGIPYSAINRIFEDSRGHIWFGTGKGVSKYDGKSLTFYTRKEGLSGNSISSILEVSTRLAKL